MRYRAQSGPQPAPKGEETHVGEGVVWGRFCLQIVTWPGTNKSINLKHRSLARSRELTNNILSAQFQKSAAQHHILLSHITKHISPLYITLHAYKVCY